MSEEQPLIPSKSYVPKSEKILTGYRTIICVLICISGGVMLFNIPFKSLSDEPGLSNFKKDDETQFNCPWTLYRHGYEPMDQFISANTFLKYNFLESYGGLIEPHASTGIYLIDKSDYEGYYYVEFSVCPKGSSTVDDCHTGNYDIVEKKSSKIRLSCEPYDEYIVEVSSISTEAIDGTVLDSFTVVCMYVRREIRSIIDEDLNATMNAMALIWYTSEEEGQVAYGENFHSISYFTRAHYFGASHRNADHIHEGLGFLPQHLKLSNAFETTLQAIDASMTLPYWDFTIDNEVEDNFYFSENTFGTLTLPAEDFWTYRSNSILDAKIPDGRWKDLKVEVDTPYSATGMQTNTYGYMRAPWNFNPSPYLSRFASADRSLPSCKNYRKWFKLTALESFLQAADTYPHTDAHDSVGGNFGCDTFDFMADLGWIDSSDSLCFKWGTYMKDLWRENYIYPDTTCEPSDDIDNPVCGFKCDADREDDMLTEFKSISGTSINSDVMTDADWSCMKKFICEGDNARSFFGDQRESASCYDPSFWPIHPTLERAYHAKMLAGGFETTDWGVEQSLCYRTTCYNDTGVEGTFDECCVGHDENDRYPDFVTGDLYNDGVWISNRDYMDATDPTSKSYSMNFIYDSFSWSHCGDEFSVDSLLEELHEGTYVDTDDSVADRTLAPTPTISKTARPTRVSVAPTPTVPTSPTVHTLRPTTVELSPVTIRTIAPTHETVPTTSAPTFVPPTLKPTHKPTAKPSVSQTPTKKPTSSPTYRFQCDSEL